MSFSAVPDRVGRGDERLVVLLPLRGRRVEVEAVRPRRPEHAREPVIADGEVVREPVVERDLAAVVEAHHLVLRGAGVLLDEAVVLAGVELIVNGVPAVRRILGREVRHLEDLHGRAVRSGIRLVARQPLDLGLARVARVRLERAEEVIERAVLHHEHDDVLDAREELLRRERSGGRRCGGGCGRGWCGRRGRRPRGRRNGRRVDRALLGGAAATCRNDAEADADALQRIAARERVVTIVHGVLPECMAGVR